MNLEYMRTGVLQAVPDFLHRMTPGSAPGAMVFAHGQSGRAGRLLRAVLAGALLLPSWPLLAQGDAEAAILDALKAGQVQKAFDLSIGEAERGNAWAMDMVAVLRLNGPAPVKRDYGQAFQWLTKAADLGNADAMSRLGEMYFGGLGIGKDLPMALTWYRRGAEAGSHAAMNNLAACLLDGTGVPKDVSAGLAIMTAAAADDPVAQENLATILRLGRYGRSDPQQALELFEKAAASGSSNAMVSLAQMHFNGEGVPADIGLSCRWSFLAYTKGRSEAAAHIANVCRPRLTRDEFEAEASAAKLWVGQHPQAWGPLARP